VGGEAADLRGRREAAIDDLLAACWRVPSDRQFFAKAVLQPYARRLAEAGSAPI